MAKSYEVTTVDRDFRNINNKKLVNDMAEFIEDCVKGPSSLLKDIQYRQAFCEVITNFLDEEYQQTGIFINFKVIGDERNNTDNDLLKFQYNLYIQFRQNHCLNITKLRFKIHFKSPIGSFFGT